VLEELASGLNILDMNVYNWSGLKALIMAKLSSSVNCTTSGVGSGKQRAFHTVCAFTDRMILLPSNEIICLVEGTKFDTAQ
jgi:hypothetical protein